VRIAVVGATGAAGRPIAAELERRGHEVRRLSRGSAEHPVDLLSGRGLDAALEACEAVVDASNAGPARGAARGLLVEGGGRLLAAGERAGVGHHVCLSIVGIERVPLGYYQVKVEQERVVCESNVPHSIVRATQFHGLIAGAFAALGRFRILPRLEAPLQPIDPAEVARVVAAVAEGGPQEMTSVAGPEISTVSELARAWRERTATRAALVPVPAVGAAGRALRAGALTDPAPEHRGTATFEEWLAQHADEAPGGQSV